MTIEDEYSAKTVSGGIYYGLKEYNDYEIFQPHWEQLSYYLRIDKSAVYCIEITNTGFRLSIKDKTFIYTHSGFHNERVIELTSIA